MSPLAKRMRQETITKEIEEYRRNLLGLREAYQSTLIEVDICGRSIEDLAKSLSKVILQPMHSGAQTLPRVVIIGSRGSGMKTQAKLLSKRFKLIHGM
jgi:ATPase subunit of ABC transporter with duplicated ATPase domains